MVIQVAPIQKALSEPKRIKEFSIFIAVALAVSIIIASALASINKVTVSDGVTFVSCSIFGGTVRDALEKGGVAVGENDIVFPGLDFKIKQNTSVNILRAFPVDITVGETVTGVQTVGYTVSEVLSNNGITLSELDVVNPPLDSVVTKGTNISVIKVTKDMVTESVSIPYKTISTPNANLERGTVKVITEGKTGIKELAYNVVYENGKEVSRELAGEKIVSEPVNAVSEYGSRIEQVVARSQETRSNSASASVSASAAVSNTKDASGFSYSRVITCSATAYTASTCGKSPGDPAYGITATGAKARRGIIAVDPKVIPLGTKVYIETSDGSYVYGTAVAADTGGSYIQGNKVDLYMDSYNECINFGKRTVKVYILD